MKLIYLDTSVLVALMTNKLRALLTTIGIGVGIAAVIVLVSLGNAVQGYLTRQFLSVGSDLIYVRSAPSAQGFGQRVGRSGVELSLNPSPPTGVISPLLQRVSYLLIQIPTFVPMVP